MRNRAIWIRSAAAAVLISALAGLLPFAPALRATTAADRGRIWLLTVWTAGVLTILFGAAGWISGQKGMGFRDVATAGSLEKAAEQRKARGPMTPQGFAPAAVVTGAMLVLIYFAGWLVLRRG
jgi:amino acid transporter